MKLTKENRKEVVRRVQEGERRDLISKDFKVSRMLIDRVMSDEAKETIEAYSPPVPPTMTIEQLKRYQTGLIDFLKTEKLPQEKKDRINCEINEIDYHFKILSTYTL